MKWKFEEADTRGMLSITIDDPKLEGQGLLKPQQNTINTFVLNKGKSQVVTIDGIDYVFPSSTVLPLVANQHFVFERAEELVAWQFNREFYCIVEHDAEVGCVGFLFYGINHPFFVSLSSEEMKSLQTIEELFIEDITLDDYMQGEMLRTMLKRLIIKITRIARKQSRNYAQHNADKMEMIRKFSLLVECNFRQQHDVLFYARALNKSPKTLSNIFSLCHYPPPSKIIQKRIILEAMRCIQYTGKSAKEIAYELGFATPAHFSRFFKNNAGRSFTQWHQREKQQIQSI